MELENGQVLTYSHDITRDGKVIAVYKKGPPIKYRPTGKPRTGRPRKTPIYKPTEEDIDQFVEEARVDNIVIDWK